MIGKGVSANSAVFFRRGAIARESFLVNNLLVFAGEKQNFKLDGSVERGRERRREAERATERATERDTHTRREREKKKYIYI